MPASELSVHVSDDPEVLQVAVKLKVDDEFGCVCVFTANFVIYCSVREIQVTVLSESALEDQGVPRRVVSQPQVNSGQLYFLLTFSLVVWPTEQTQYPGSGHCRHYLNHSVRIGLFIK